MRYFSYTINTMRKTILIFTGFAAALACGGCAMFGTTTPDNGMAFNVSYANYQANIRWSEYKEPDFSGYRIIKSSSERVPQCTEKNALFIERNSSVTSYTDSGLDEGAYYYRLCVDKTDGSTLSGTVRRIFVKGGAYEAEVNSPSAF